MPYTGKNTTVRISREQQQDVVSDLVKYDRNGLYVRIQRKAYSEYLNDLLP